MKPDETRKQAEEHDPMDPADDRDPGFTRSTRSRFEAGSAEPVNPAGANTPTDPPAGYARGNDPEMQGAPELVPTTEQPVDDERDLFAREPWMPSVQSREEPEADHTPPRIPHPAKLMVNRWVVGLLLLATAVIGLIIVNQAAAFIERLNATPMLLRWAGYGLLAILLAAALYAVARLGWLFARLRASPQLLVPGLAELRRRGEFTEQDRGRLREARSQLRRFIADYPLDRDGDKRRLKRLGLTDSEVQQLRTSQARLTAERGGSDREWVRSANEQFVKLLDAAAQRRRRRYALLVGLKTGAVPSGFLDAIVALMNAYLLVGDLCRLYNLRTTMGGTGVILGWVFVQTYTAAQMEDLGGEAAGSLTEQASQPVEMLSKQIGGRVVEFGVNALMIYRLGTITMRRLRPIR